MRGGAQRPDQVRLAGTGLAVEQQNARLTGGAVLRRHRIEQRLKLAPRLRVHDLDIDRIGPPDVVLPGDGVVECGGQAVGMLR